MADDSYLLQYAVKRPGVDWPAVNGMVVTTSDSLNLTYNGKTIVTRGVYVGGTGALTVDFAGGLEGIGEEFFPNTQVLLSAIPAGTLLPIRVKKIWSTGTDATLIVALW